MNTNSSGRTKVNHDQTMTAPEEAVETITGSATPGGYNILEILDAIPFYVLLVDSDHYILEANSAVKTHLGVEREEILGKYCPAVIHGIQQPFEGCPLEEAVEKNTAVERELFDKKTGRWVLSAIYPTRSLTRQGKKVFLHMVIDITERKQAQEQLRLSHIQLRNLSAHLEIVREEEKRKIARDLHDETSQVLASLHAYLEAAVTTLPESAEKTRDLLKKAQDLSTAILDEIHKLIYELRPTTLDELGLVPAINSLVQNSLQMAGIRVRTKTTGRARRLPPSMEIALFRIVQEALNNVVKHAQAHNVDILLAFKSSSVKISVKDDGRGFDVRRTESLKDRSGGMGLIGIRERISLMNGQLILNSRPGQGTELTIVVPLPDKESHG